MKLLLCLLMFISIAGRAQTIYITALDSTTICNGHTARFSATVTSVTSPHYQWQVNNTSAGTDSSLFSTTDLHDGDTVSCQLTNATHDTILAHSANLNITIQNMPDAGVITGADTFVCVGATTVLTDTTAGGVWVVASDHCSVTNGTVTGISDGGFECPAPYLDTIYYVVSNSCGTDTAKYPMLVHAFPNAYFELVDRQYGYIYLSNAVTCMPPFQYGYFQGLEISNGWMEAGFLCEGEIHAKHDFVAVGGFYGRKPGVDTIVCVSTNICGTATHEMQITVIEKPQAPKITKLIDKLCAGERDSIIAPGSSSCAVTAGASVLFSNSVVYVTGGSIPGLVTITLHSSNMCGWTDTLTTIEIKETPTPIFGKDSVCAGYPLVLADWVSGGVWGTLDEAIASVNATGIVSGITEGTAVIKYSLTNGCTVTKDIQVIKCEKEVELYPNPASGELTVHLFVDIYQSYKIYNILGQEVGSNALDGEFTRLDIRFLPNGIYFLKLIGTTTNTVQKLVKE